MYWAHSIKTERKTQRSCRPSSSMPASLFDPQTALAVSTHQPRYEQYKHITCSMYIFFDRAQMCRPVSPVHHLGCLFYALVSIESCAQLWPVIHIIISMNLSHSRALPNRNADMQFWAHEPQTPAMHVVNTNAIYSNTKQPWLGETRRNRVCTFAW